MLVPVLVLASGGLYLWPGDTDATFAWTVKPELTPLVMGAGYASGLVYFSLVAFPRGRRWLEVSFGLIGITALVTLLGVATILHWDKFDHGHPSFWAWAFLYAAAPILVPALWVYNGGWERPRADSTEVRVPSWARVALGLFGAASLLVGLVIFIEPSIAIDHWGWDVTPLTARVVANFIALNVGWAAVALDGRWVAMRIPALSQIVGFTLLLGGILRARDDLHTERAATWIYIAVVAAIVGLLGWLFVAMSERAPEAEIEPAS